MNKPRITLINRITSVVMVIIMTLTTGVVAFSFVSVSDWGENRLPFLFADEINLSVPAIKMLPVEASLNSIVIESESVARDLEITVRLENGLLAAGIPFTFKVVSVEDDTKVITVLDEDMDGKVYIEDIDEGDYLIELLPQKGIVPPEAIIATVLSRIAYSKVEIKEKVKTVDEIDVSKDDSKYQEKTNDNGGTPPPPPSSNTVDFIESSKVEEKIVEETPLLDGNGRQIVKYKPNLADGGYLINAAGTPTDILAVLDEQGYIIGARRRDPGSSDESPTYTDCTSEVLDVAGVPIVEGDHYKYKFEGVPQVSRTEKTVTHYYGWQTIDGRVYYFDKNGNKVTGRQVIQNIEYFFSDEGVRGGSVGIDVSTWQDNIDWNKVKASGVDFAFIRLGFRGYQSGALVLDNFYNKNMKGAIAAGIRVGVYFFSQAINETEAIEEASMCLEYVRGYSLSLPIVIDVESAGSSSARTNNLTADQLTRICIAFCETIRSGGYTPCVYANKYYLTSKLKASQLSGYVIWLAHYTSSQRSDYSGKYDIWQHTSTGRVNGIVGNVDMNISYIF